MLVLRVAVLGLIAASTMLGCAAGGASARATAPRAPEWVTRPETCHLSGRISLEPQLVAKDAGEPLAKVECRHLRVQLLGDDGSSLRVEPAGNLAAGFGECHFDVPAFPRGQMTVNADFDLEPALQGTYTVKTSAPFNSVVCDEDSRNWNQQLDLLLTLPDVLGNRG